MPTFLSFLEGLSSVLLSMTPQFPRNPQDGPEGPQLCAEARAYPGGCTEPTGPERGIWGPTRLEPAVGSVSCADGPHVFDEGHSLLSVECRWHGPGSHQITCLTATKAPS